MKAIVVEDSRLAREGLVNMLRGFPGLQVVGEADHPSSALPLIQESRPDVVFLDIHMPGESGFDLLEKLDYMPRVIFTTAYSEYAIRSFDYHTVDYLLKPISHERLAVAISKLAVGHGREQEQAEARAPLDIGSQILVRDGGKCHLVALADIRYFESCKNYVRIFFDNDSSFVKKSLSQVEERLPGRHFFRISRQYIVNLREVAKIEESVGDGYELTMSDGRTMEVSRRNAAVLKDLLSL